MIRPVTPPDLKGRIEQALALIYRSNATLRPVAPQPWKPTPKRPPPFRIIIQATPAGEEMQAGTGIYQTTITVTTTGRTPKYDPAKYLAAVSDINHGFGQMHLAGDSDGFDAIFLPYGLKVYSAWPQEIPATINNDSLIDNCGLIMVGGKL